MDGKLTDEQIDFIAKELDDSIEGTVLQKIANLPSNNGKLERSKDEISEVGEAVRVNVSIDPNTGEHVILGPAKDKEEESFDQIIERINSSDMDDFDKKPISEEEIMEFVASGKDNGSILSEISNNVDISPNSIKKLLEIVNRKKNREEFNIFKEFPDEIKSMIINYMNIGGIPVYSKEGKQFKNLISEQLINDFISNIEMDRVKNDFSKELEEIFNKGSQEIADSIIGYTNERNKKYREYADQIEDADKKEKLLLVLDKIDEAYDLNELKEFSKTCKIKSIEFEKPQSRVFSSFLAKYKNSTYNIYDINMTVPILYRNLNLFNSEGDEFIEKDVYAFLIAFCKQCNNMTPDLATDHAYMYYVLYNIVLTDINTGNSADISRKFLDNIKEIIYNLRAKNMYYITKN